MSEMIKVTGLWANKDKNGNQYLSGNLTPTIKILIFKNSYKSTDKHPDYIMSFAQNMKKDDAAPASDVNTESPFQEPEQNEPDLPF
jgi:hypothetical protein